MPRTEEQKITQAPLKLKFGEKEYEVKPLRILKQREWRSKLQAELGPVVESLQIGKVNNRTFVAGLSAAISQFPDKVCELVFAYSLDLERERAKILDEATEEQMAHAFAEIWHLVFDDFLAQLGSANEMLRPTPSPQSAPVLN